MKTFKLSPRALIFLEFLARLRIKFYYEKARIIEESKGIIHLFFKLSSLLYSLRYLSLLAVY
jgi:hypothetical protein